MPMPLWPMTLAPPIVLPGALLISTPSSGVAEIRPGGVGADELALHQIRS